MPVKAEFAQRLQSIERLVSEIESTADSDLRTTVQELLQLVMDLHGAGLDRMLELIRAEEDGEIIVQKLGRDELVASLLVLYGIHPVDMAGRVAQALDKARTRFRPHDGEVELVSIEDGAVRLRLHVSGHGETIREIVESAVYQSAPDVVSLVIEGADPKPVFVPLEMLLASSTSSRGGL